jgi:hypothetical protein
MLVVYAQGRREHRRQSKLVCFAFYSRTDELSDGILRPRLAFRADECRLTAFTLVMKLPYNMQF